MSRPSATHARVLAGLFLVALLVMNPVASDNWALTFGVGLGAVPVTWVGLNLWGRQRPFAPPRTVTWREYTAFVAVPALTALTIPQEPYVFEGMVLLPTELALLGAAGAALSQLVLMWIASLVARSGLIAVFPWIGRQVVVAFLSAGVALGRTIPLLLGVVGLLFFTTELWQSVGRLASWAYLSVLLLFALLSLTFLHNPEHLDLGTLASFGDEAELQEILADTPLAHTPGVPLPAECPLTPSQVKDLRLVATFSRVTVVAVISLAVFAFFVFLGGLTVNAEVVKAWILDDPTILMTVETINRRYDLTLEHLRVAGFMAVFAGFYFSVVSRTDAALREGMRDTAEDTVREACAARLVALARFPIE